VKVVLDADVLIGALDASDPHHAEARALFTAWQARGDTRLISLINLSEVLVAPAADVRRLRAAREAVRALGVSTHRPGEAIGVRAARLRSEHPISLPDAYCLATADHTGSTLASFDDKVLRAARSEKIPVEQAARSRSRRS
jgi:predicted nucleic acid-binding protein